MAKPFRPRDDETTDPSIRDDSDERTDPGVSIIHDVEDVEDVGDDPTQELEEGFEGERGGFGDGMMGTLGNGPMEGNLAAAIQQRQAQAPGAEPAVMQIVNEIAKGTGRRVNGPTLWRCLADYLDTEPKNLTELAAALIRMYEDLKRRGMDDARWAEIKGYLAMELLAVINAKHLGMPGENLVQAYTQEELTETFNAQMRERTSASQFDTEVARRTAAKIAGFNYDAIIYKLFGIDINAIIETRYQEEIAEWRKGGLLRRLVSEEKARAAVDAQYGEEGALRKNIETKLKDALAKDLENEFLIEAGYERDLWANLKNMIPEIATKLETTSSHPSIRQFYDDPQIVDAAVRNSTMEITKQYRAEELALFKQRFIELFGGEIAVEISEAGKKALTLLYGHQSAGRIFTLDPLQFKLFPQQ